MKLIFFIYIQIKTRYPTLSTVIIRGFIGSNDEAIKYLEQGFYLGLTGYLCKVCCTTRKLLLILILIKKFLI